MIMAVKNISHQDRDLLFAAIKLDLSTLRWHFRCHTPGLEAMRQIKSGHIGWICQREDGIYGLMSFKYSDDGEYIWLSNIIGREGGGSELLEDLKKHAQIVGKPIYCISIGTSEANRWYAKHGFGPVGDQFGWRSSDEHSSI